jgi:Tfp pilus assembly protein PilX
MKKQHGAVLIFSLIMLLLMSLLGINAMQQNRLQFLMSSNSQLQTNTLSQAENLLVIAEKYLDDERHEVQDGDDDVDVEDNKIIGKCAKNDDGKFELFTVPQNITNPLPITGEMKAASEISVLDCECLATNAACQTSFTACLSEIYTVEVKLTGTDGTKRTVESKYAVQCVQ